jgi:hypothetical protein
MLVLPHLGRIEGQDPYVAETFRAILTAVNGHAKISGVDPVGRFPAPAAPSQIAVAAANGFFDVVVTDANPLRGVEYWLEWDQSPNFPAPRQIHLVGARNWYGQLGNLTLYWRAAAQFFGSNLSAWTVYGGATPIAVVGGGAAGPAPMASSGSGAGPGIGSNPFPPVGVGRGPIGEEPAPRNVPGGRFALLSSP